MEWLRMMNAALAYIEQNLAGEIRTEDIAHITGCSAYQFQKIFTLLAGGLSLSEYIRNRRLACAADELQNGSLSVLEIGLKYGYDSPTAFNRAFQRLHGCPPSAVRSKAALRKAYPPISFHITVKGAIEMEYKIRKQKAFRALGARLATTVEDGKNLREIPAFWNEVHRDGRVARLLALCEGKQPDPTLPAPLLGICVSHGATDSSFDYYIAIPSDSPVQPGLEEVLLPEATYAVFSCVGALPAAMQTLTTHVYSEWLPSSGYRLGGGPDIEVNPEGNPSSPSYQSELWVPVEEEA